MIAERKNILLVDDEKPLLFTFRTSLAAYSSDLTVYTAENGLEAVEVLAVHPIDVVVTDLKMPRMDGFELLVHLKKHYPEIPVIVMTGMRFADWGKRLKAIGPIRVLEKPVNIKDLAVNIFQAVSTAPEGKIQGVTLPGFLQLVEMEEKSCALRIRCGERSGVLYIRKGELVDARTRNANGEAAAREIATWEGAEIELAPYEGDEPETIRAKMSEILLDAFRRKDEDSLESVDVEEDLGLDSLAGPAERPPGREEVPGETEVEEAPPQPVGGGEGAGPEAARPPDEESPRATLRALLAGLSRLPAVDAVCLVGHDGRVIDSVSLGTIEDELVGAIASGSFGDSRAIGRGLGRGALEAMTLEFERGPVVVSPVGPETLLVVVAGREAGLGMLRLRIRKVGAGIEAAAAAL